MEWLNLYERKVKSIESSYHEEELSFDEMIERRDKAYLDHLKTNTLVAVCLDRPKLVSATLSATLVCLIFCFMIMYFLIPLKFKYGEWTVKPNDHSAYWVRNEWWGLKKSETQYVWRKPSDGGAVDWCYDSNSGYYSLSNGAGWKE